MGVGSHSRLLHRYCTTICFHILFTVNKTFSLRKCLCDTSINEPLNSHQVPVSLSLSLSSHPHPPLLLPTWIMSQIVMLLMSRTVSMVCTHHHSPLWSVTLLCTVDYLVPPAAAAAKLLHVPIRYPPSLPLHLWLCNCKSCRTNVYHFLSLSFVLRVSITVFFLSPSPAPILTV